MSSLMATSHDGWMGPVARGGGRGGNSVGRFLPSCPACGLPNTSIMGRAGFILFIVILPFLPPFIVTEAVRGRSGSSTTTMAIPKRCDLIHAFPVVHLSGRKKSPCWVRPQRVLIHNMPGHMFTGSQTSRAQEQKFSPRSCSSICSQAGSACEQSFHFTVIASSW